MENIKIADFNTLEAILWDFDGVLMDSNSVRDFGFIEVLKDYPSSQVNQLLHYHQSNGGLSRYHKFRYFYEVILNQSVSDEIIMGLADRFSAIMKEKLLDLSLIIQETVLFIKRNYQLVPMYVVSGSDQEELRGLCAIHGLTQYFKSIFGSPTPKKELVFNIIQDKGFLPEKCLLVGDSINDYEAAFSNGLHFMAYNNSAISNLSNLKIDLNA